MSAQPHNPGSPVALVGFQRAWLLSERRGFSLIELVMVMAIGLVIAAIAAPRYGNALARYRADLAARRVVADLALAQSTARLASAARTITFSPATNTYRLVGIGTPKQPTIDTDVALNVEPYRANLSSVDFAGATTVTFTGFGIPNAAGTIVISSGKVQKTILIDKDTGAATIQ